MTAARPLPARLLLTLLVASALALLVPLGSARADTWPGPVRPVESATGTWPLRPDPTVVRGFDPPSSPWSSGHRGVDLAGRPGQRVRAALDGRVSFAGLLAGRGVVVVDHGATRTTYEPVSAGVRVGEVVAAGAPLGTLDAITSHCAPQTCLHWGWIRGGDYLDPLTLVGAGPIRLLPLDRAAVIGPGGLGAPGAGHRAVGSSVPLPGSPMWRARSCWAQARGWACW